MTLRSLRVTKCKRKRKQAKPNNKKLKKKNTPNLSLKLTLFARPANSYSALEYIGSIGHDSCVNRPK